MYVDYHLNFIFMCLVSLSWYLHTVSCLTGMTELQGVPITYLKDIPKKKQMPYETSERLWGHSSVSRRQMNNHCVWPLQQRQPSVSMLQRASQRGKFSSLTLRILTLGKQKPRARRQSHGYKSTGSPGQGSFIMLLYIHQRFQTAEKIKILKIYVVGMN